MKNIHLLKTDKPSRLLKDLVDETYQFKKEVLYGNWLETPLNIYITNSEEIRKGDWFLNTRSKAIGQHNGSKILLFKDDKKIILTTDQDLIKDGVQAIPDGFLEWFVKNPSCDEIYVNKIESFNSGWKNFYKIIIPKEEPKTFKVMIVGNGLPKQETLEEVAERLYPYEVGCGVFDRNCEIDIERERFIEGAKWQKEQDNKLHSEEVKQLIKHFVKTADFIDFTKEHGIRGWEELDKWLEQNIKS